MALTINLLFVEEETSQCYCGKSNDSPSINYGNVANRIIGGSEANRNEYPWQVSNMVNNVDVL